MREREVRSAEPGQTFIDWSDERLKAKIRELGAESILDYPGLLNELNRRAADRQARATNFLSAVSAAIALAALIATFLRG